MVKVKTFEKVMGKAKKALDKGKGISVIENKGETKMYHIVQIYEFKKKIPPIIIDSFFKEQLKFVKKLIDATGNKAFAVKENNKVIFEEWAELDDEALKERMQEPRFFAGKEEHLIDESKVKGVKKVITKAVKPQAKGVRKGLSKLYDFHYKLYEVQENGEKLIEEA